MRLSLILVIMIVPQLFISLYAGTNGVRFGERPYIDIYQMPDESMEQSKIQIKFHQKMTGFLDSTEIISDASGIALFGIPEIDELNRSYGVHRVVKLFESPALKNGYEWRHRQWGFHLWYELHFDSGTDIRDIVMAYRSLKNIIEWAEPEYKKILVGDPSLENAEDEPGSRWIPNDPDLEDQWHYNNTGQQNGTPGADISLFDAWDIEKGHSDVIVAIIDSGVQFNHPDLAANMWEDIGFNFVNNISTIYPGNHGTHVAGTVAAVSNNNVGVAGVAGGSGTGDGVRLMSCQVFTDSSQGGFHLAPVYAADNDAAISQNSWSYTTEGSYNQNVLDAIDYFNANGGGDVLDGGITIFAAGNRGTSGNFYPGIYPGTFSVAGTNNQDQKAWYSTYDFWIDISAPGGETNTVTARGVLSTRINNGYGYAQGTSMACPHTSGVAALIISHAYRNNTILSNADVADIIRDTTDNHYGVNPAYLNQLGTGRLNAYAALIELQEEYLNVMEPGSIAAITAGLHQIDLSWEQNSNGNDVMLIWSPDGEFGSLLDGIIYEAGDTLPGGGTVLYCGSNTSYSHTGLEEATIYYYSAFSYNSDYEYSVGITIEAHTDYEFLILPLIEDFNHWENLPHFWEMVDHVNSGLYWQFGTFTGGLESTTGNYAYLNSNEYGEDTTQHTGLITPKLNLSGYSEVTLSFTHYFKQHQSNSLVIVYYSINNGASWTTIDSWVHTTANPAYFSEVIPAVAGQEQVRFKWNYIGSDGWFWCIDDIGITGELADFAVPENLNAVAGNEYVYLSWSAPVDLVPTGYNIYRDDVMINTALISNTEYEDYDVTPFENYLYYVTAQYPQGESEPSETVAVTPYALIPPQNLIASVDNADVYLQWEEPEIPAGRRNSSDKMKRLSAERDNPIVHLTGYNIYRNEEIINTAAIEIPEYIDKDLPAGTYTYHVIAVYTEGESEPSNEVEVEVTLSADDETLNLPVTKLHGNFPNPFNPDTTISFSLRKAGHVSLEIFNTKGQKVATIVDGTLEAGAHQVRWNGKTEGQRNSGSGIFLYRLSTEGYTAIRRMVLLK